jgi:hypothetical protein
MDHPWPLVCFTTIRTGRYSGRVRDLPKHHALHELLWLLDGANTRADSALWITTRGGPWRVWSRLPATRRATSSAGDTGNPVPAAATLLRTVPRLNDARSPAYQRQCVAELLPWERCRLHTHSNAPRRPQLSDGTVSLIESEPT